MRISFGVLGGILMMVCCLAPKSSAETPVQGLPLIAAFERIKERGGMIRGKLCNEASLSGRVRRHGVTLQVESSKEPRQSYGLTLTVLSHVPGKRPAARIRMGMNAGWQLLEKTPTTVKVKSNFNWEFTLDEQGNVKGLVATGYSDADERSYRIGKVGMHTYQVSFADVREENFRKLHGESGN